MSALLIWDNANDYRTTPQRRVEDGRDMAGKVVVVTGATGALGRATCLALYRGGATVVATGRDLEKTQRVCDELKAEAEAETEAADQAQTTATTTATTKKGGGGNLEAMQLDVGDYESIRAFVANLKTGSISNKKKVDVLINNAGVIPPKEYTESKHGLEVTYQTNFASVVVLTELMLPLMNGADGARIVNVSSMSHAHGPDPNNWDAVPSTKETFGGYDKDYCESKWLVTAYTHHLHERFLKSSTGTGTATAMAAVAADPGVSPDSAMWDNVSPIRRFLVKYVFKFLTKTSDQAAACGVSAAVTPDVVSGGYYVSGVSYPDGMRPDCRDADEWNKAATILKQKLPNDLAELVHESSS